MTALAIGLVLFLGVHSVGMLAPGLRARAIARIGEGQWKALYALLSLAGLVLVGRGWGAAEATILFDPVPGAAALLLIVMPVLLVLVVAGNLPAGRIRRAARHPMLLATAIWGLLHLLANGDAAATLLFGGFALWAAADMASLVARDRRAAAAGPHAGGPPGKAATGPMGEAALPWWPDIAALAVGLALYAWLVADGHVRLFGVSPLG